MAAACNIRSGPRPAGFWHAFRPSMAWLALMWASTMAIGQSAIVPGEYITERGWGQLSVKAGRDGRPVFAIEALGANGHSCSLDGPVDKGRAVLEGEDSHHPCVITFTAKGQGIDVRSNGTCRMYCGMRAGFDDFYVRPPPGCAVAQVRRTRNDFKRLYDRKDYRQAREKLDPVLANCEKYLWWLDEGWIRNDLAITMHRLGDHDRCRGLLSKYADDAALPDEEIAKGYPPSDAEGYLSVVKAVRTNLRLCTPASARR